MRLVIALVLCWGLYYTGAALAVFAVTEQVVANLLHTINGALHV